MSACTRGGCKKAIKPEDECFACALCKVQYCSAECGQSDWIAHNCPNVVTLPVEASAESNICVPYFWEDMLPDDVVASLAPTDPVFAAYSVQHRNANGTVKQRIEPSLLERAQDLQTEPVGEPVIGITEKGEFLGRGTSPDISRDGLTPTYTISIMARGLGADTQTIEVDGNTQEDMIYLRNRSNPAAAQLAGKGLKGLFRGGGFRRRLTKRSQKYVFWPPPAAVYRQGLEVPKGGYISVTVAAGSKSVTIDGYYELKDKSELSKSVKKNFDFQLRTKFRESEAGKSISISTKDVQVIKGRDLRGNQFALAFVLNPGDQYAQLVDVEVMVAANRLHGGTLNPDAQGEDDNYSYYNKKGGKKKGKWMRSKDVIGSVVFEHDLSRINPKDTSAMMGLALALEITAASDRQDLKEIFDGGTKNDQRALQALENYSKVINRHVRWMDSVTDKEIRFNQLPSDVDSALDGAVQMLYDPVGRGLTSSAKWKDKLERVPRGDRENFAEARARQLGMRMANARAATGVKAVALKIVKSVTIRQLDALEKAIRQVSRTDGLGYETALKYIDMARNPASTDPADFE